MITNEEWIKMMYAYMKDKEEEVFSLRQNNERLYGLIAQLSYRNDILSQENTNLREKASVWVEVDTEESDPCTKRSQQHPQVHERYIHPVCK